MIEYKQGLTARVPVRLFNTATGNPETGVVFGSVTAAVEKSDGTAGAVVVGAGAWAEVTTGAFAGKGYYNLILPVASTDTAGVLFYAVTVALTNGHVGCVKVVANEEVDTYTRIGAPAGGVSISADVALKAAAATAMSNAVWTDARAGYLDKANVVGDLASAADVATIQNNTSTRIVLDSVFERPDTASVAEIFDLYLYDSDGHMEDPDSTPTLTVTNNLGVDRSANLTNAGIMQHPGLGHYRIGYTVASTHALEPLRFEVTVVEGGNTRVAGAATSVLDTTAVQFSQEDRDTLNSISTNTGVLLDHAEGRWQIFDTGADANRIVFYTRAGAVLAKFDLQALDGSPSIRSPFARVPVIP